MRALKMAAATVWMVAVTWPGLGQSSKAATTGKVRMTGLEAVDVYLNDRDDSSQLLGPGTPLASGIFQRIGVRLKWHRGQLRTARSSGHDAAAQPAFGIRTAKHAPESATSNALASAQLLGWSGAEITVYEDRVRRFLQEHHSLAEGVATGYVLAHELAHVMQGFARHSESGILKTRWSRDDYRDMVYHKLAFTASDVELIHQGLALQLANRRSEQRAEAESGNSAVGKLADR
jgi:hypothetical protein